MEKQLDDAIKAGRLPGLHAVLIAKFGQIELERYLSGSDESWDKSLGTIDFTPETLHDVRSVTKSIVGLLYGIALDRGLVPGLQARLLDSFPQYADLAADPVRKSITIEHTLTMTTGLQWDESAPYTSVENDEIGMEFAADRYRFVLEKPVVSEPGASWAYSGGSVALVGALISGGTCQSISDFARETLFEPLGISDFEWMAGEDGVVSPASGLRLRAPDLMRIGLMCLQNGEWNGQQVVPRSWIEDSLKPSVATGHGIGYGRLWWVGYPPGSNLEPDRKWVAAFGNGGQRLMLLPSADTVMVVLAGNYNARDSDNTPTRIWKEIVLGQPAT